MMAVGRREKSRCGGQREREGKRERERNRGCRREGFQREEVVFGSNG